MHNGEHMLNENDDVAQSAVYTSLHLNYYNRVFDFLVAACQKYINLNARSGRIMLKFIMYSINMNIERI